MIETVTAWMEDRLGDLFVELINDAADVFQLDQDISEEDPCDYIIDDVKYDAVCKVTLEPHEEELDDRQGHDGRGPQMDGTERRG